MLRTQRYDPRQNNGVSERLQVNCELRADGDVNKVNVTKTVVTYLLGGI